MAHVDVLGCGRDALVAANAQFGLALSEDDEGAAPEPACPQPGPEEQAMHRERLAQTLARLDTLPAGQREAFRLRVLQDRPTGEVCARLAISEENLFVRLHRVRKALAA